jgi:hypothetical protein
MSAYLRRDCVAHINYIFNHNQAVVSYPHHIIDLSSKNSEHYAACCGAARLIWFIENSKIGKESQNDLCVFLKS